MNILFAVGPFLFPPHIHLTSTPHPTGVIHINLTRHAFPFFTAGLLLCITVKYKWKSKKKFRWMWGGCGVDVRWTFSGQGYLH